MLTPSIAQGMEGIYVLLDVHNQARGIYVLLDVHNQARCASDNLHHGIRTLEIFLKGIEFNHQRTIH